MSQQETTSNRTKLKQRLQAIVSMTPSAVDTQALSRSKARLSVIQTVFRHGLGTLPSNIFHAIYQLLNNGLPA
eukprot:scaffold245702_cov12-Prasinocladus_malaysianus.AAC.1